MHMINAARMCIPVHCCSKVAPAIKEWLFRVDRIAEMEEFFFYCTVWGLKVYDHLGILSNNTFLSTTYHGHVVRDPYTLGLCFGNVVDLLNALS